MKTLFIGSVLSMISPSMIYIDLNTSTNLRNWVVVDDVVMGGKSNGDFYINDDGTGIFEGSVSLENNGGFSSIRHRFYTPSVDEYSKFKIRVKGDGKRYQFRVKSRSRDYQSYISYFETTNKWQTIEIPFEEMSASFRGMKLRMPNYPGEKMEEIAFLIGNNKAEQFRLEIDWIKLE